MGQQRLGRVPGGAVGCVVPAPSDAGYIENLVFTAPLPARKFGPRTEYRYCSPVPVETRCVDAVPECTGEATWVAPTAVHRARLSFVGASKNALFAVRLEIEKSDA